MPYFYSCVSEYRSISVQRKWNVILTFRFHRYIYGRDAWKRLNQVPYCKNLRLYWNFIILRLNFILKKITFAIDKTKISKYISSWIIVFKHLKITYYHLFFITLNKFIILWLKTGDWHILLFKNFRNEVHKNILKF